MKDCKGSHFTIGSKLKSTQSPEGCGIVLCTGVSSNLATLKNERWLTKENEITLDQRALENSFWEVI